MRNSNQINFNNACDSFQRRPKQIRRLLIVDCSSSVRTERFGGAWCPQKPATAEPEEWLQVDLKTIHMITATGTQGRFGNGQGVEYAEAYMLEYWRPRLNKWIRYRNNLGEEVSVK